MTVISVVTPPPFSSSQLTVSDAALIRAYADNMADKVFDPEPWDWAGIGAGTGESLAQATAFQSAAYANVLGKR